MARPKTPLISRRKTLEVALRILNEEGLEALSIRRLAAELNVNGASLYHHFANKDEILLGVASLALATNRVPETDDVEWRPWFLETTLNYRKALLENPGLVAILLSRHPLRMALPYYDAATEVLTSHGVPLGTVMPLIETVETFVVGSVVFATACRDDMRGLKTELRRGVPSVAAAIRHAAFATGDDELWKASCEAIIETVLAEAARVSAGEAEVPARRGRRLAAVPDAAEAKPVRRRASAPAKQ